MLGKVATVRSLEAARARAISVSSNINYIQEWVEFMELHVESEDTFMGIFKKYDFSRDVAAEYVLLYINCLDQGALNEGKGAPPSTLRARITMVMAWLDIFRQGKYAGLPGVWRRIKKFEKKHVRKEKRVLSLADLEKVLRILEEKMKAARGRTELTTADSYDAAGTLVVHMMVIAHFRVGNILRKTEKGNSKDKIEFTLEGVEYHGDYDSPEAATVSTFEKKAYLNRPTGELVKAVKKGLKPLRPVKVFASKNENKIGILEVLKHYENKGGYQPSNFQGPIRFKDRKGDWKVFKYSNFKKWLEVSFPKGSLGSLGMENLLPSNLRATGITYLLKMLPLEMVSRLVGHAGIATTLKYYIGWSLDEIAVVNAQFQAALLGEVGPSMEKYEDDRTQIIRTQRA
jgi:integrase